MPPYRQELQLRAPAATVYAALATRAGLRGWWSEDADIAEQEGGVSTFRFGPHWKKMEIESLLPDREVRWHCVGAFLDVPGLSRKDEWVGTRIVFRLQARGPDATHLEVAHFGLTPDLGCYALCEQGWNDFLASLRALVETGTGRPFRPAAATPATERREHA